MKNLKDKKITILLVLVEVLILVAILLYSILFGRISVFKMFSKPKAETAAVSSVSTTPDEAINAILEEEYEEDTTQAEEATEEQEISDELPLLQDLLQGREEVAELQSSSEVENKLASMTEDEKIYQLIITTLDSFDKTMAETEVGDITRSNYADAPLGGIVFTSDNFIDSDQFGIMRNAVKEYSQEISNMTLLTINSEVNPVAKGNGLKRFTGWDDTVSKKSLSNATLVMVTKKTIPEITGNSKLPCTLSVKAVDHIRDTMKYKGVLVSGDLCNELVAANFSVSDAAVAALYAGTDMLYCTNGYEEVYSGIKTALADGSISETMLDNAVRRILTLKLS